MCYMNRRGTEPYARVVWEDGGSDPASYPIDTRMTLSWALSIREMLNG